MKLMLVAGVVLVCAGCESDTAAEFARKAKCAEVGERMAERMRAKDRGALVTINSIYDPERNTCVSKWRSTYSDHIYREITDTLADKMLASKIQFTSSEDPKEFPDPAHDALFDELSTKLFPRVD